MDKKEEEWMNNIPRINSVQLSRNILRKQKQRIEDFKEHFMKNENELKDDVHYKLEQIPWIVSYSIKRGLGGYIVIALSENEDWTKEDELMNELEIIFSNYVPNVKNFFDFTYKK